MQQSSRPHCMMLNGVVLSNSELTCRYHGIVLLFRFFPAVTDRSIRGRQPDRGRDREKEEEKERSPKPDTLCRQDKRMRIVKRDERGQRKKEWVI